MMLRSPVLIASLGSLLSPAIGTAEECGGLPLIYSTGFERGAEGWSPTDPAAWQVTDLNGHKVYHQFKRSRYDPPHRSPHNIALLNDHGYWDDVKLHGTKVERPAKSE